MAKVDPACTGGCTMQHAAPDVGVFGGIVIGITAALLWQRYYRIKLVPWLAFFGGRRFVPILMASGRHGLGRVLRPGLAADR